MKEGWEYKTLGECCDVYNGNSINSDYKMKNFSGRKEGYPFIATKDVSFNGIINYDNGIKIPFETNYKIAFPGSVFICAEGGSAGRKIALVNKKVCFGNKLFCIAPYDNEEFIGKYIYYYMNSALFQNQFRTFLTGLIGGVSAKKFRDILLLKIPFNDQRRIVSYLDSSFQLIDKIKEKAQKSLSEAKALFQSALAEAMEPKEGWEEKTLGDVGSFKRGGNFTKRDFIEDGFPCVHYGQIHMKFGHITKQHISCVPKELVKKDRCAKKGDLIIAITSEDDEGSCKCTAWMANYEVYVGGHTAIYTHILDPIFMSYFFLSPRFQKEKLEYTHGFKVVEINPKDIAKIPIFYPPLSTQKRIVSHLDKLSSNVKQMEEKYQKIVEECDALKQAMLRDVFE